ncbi:MAG: hypothetical protein V1829_00020 [bacterium]
MFKETKTILDKSPIIAITTNNSIKVNPLFFEICFYYILLVDVYQCG